MKRHYLIVLGMLFLAGGLAPKMQRPRGGNSIMQQPADALRIFAGSIMRQGDNFILNDPVNKRVYMLDDAETASPYAGKKVKVTGTLDVEQDTIRTDRIDVIG